MTLSSSLTPEVSRIWIIEGSKFHSTLSRPNTANSLIRNRLVYLSFIFLCDLKLCMSEGSQLSPDYQVALIRKVFMILRSLGDGSVCKMLLSRLVDLGLDS